MQALLSELVCSVVMYYSRSSCYRTPTESRKSVRNWSWPLTRMYKIQSFYELEFKQGFVKVAVNKAVCLRECPLRELRLYFDHCFSTLIQIFNLQGNNPSLPLPTLNFLQSLEYTILGVV